MKPRPVVMITGARGFLGSSLALFLANRQQNVRIFRVGRRECNMLSRPAVDALLKKVKPGIIFHFAGGRFDDNQATLQANFETTKNLLDSIAASKMKIRVVIPGSAAEYGNITDKKLIDEGCLPKPLGWYGFAKLLQTDLGLYYARQGLDVVVVRMFNICGAGTPATLAIGGFAKQIVEIELGAEPVIRTKNLSGKRDFLDIQDVCRGLWMIAAKGRNGEIYNLCSGQRSSIRQLLKRLLSLAKVKNIRIEENKKDASLSFDVIGSNVKFKKAVPWSILISLEQSLQNTMDSYREQ